jgi:hypothetical protein
MVKLAASASARSSSRSMLSSSSRKGFSGAGDQPCHHRRRNPLTVIAPEPKSQAPTWRLIDEVPARGQSSSRAQAC